MRPDFGMFERPHPTAALFIFPANETPRFGEKQLLMNLMRVARRVRIPLETPRDKCGCHRWSGVLDHAKRSALTEPLFTLLAINQLTTVAAALTGTV